MKVSFFVRQCAPYWPLILTPFIAIGFKYRLPDVGAENEGLDYDSQDKSHVR